MPKEEKRLICRWDRAAEENGILYQTECQKYHVFESGSPTDNGFAFCPFCSKLIADGGGSNESDIGL